LLSKDNKRRIEHQTRLRERLNASGHEDKHEVWLHLGLVQTLRVLNANHLLHLRFGFHIACAGTKRRKQCRQKSRRRLGTRMAGPV